MHFIAARRSYLDNPMAEAVYQGTAQVVMDLLCLLRNEVLVEYTLSTGPSVLTQASP